MGKSRFLVAGFYWMYTTYRPMVLQNKKNKHTFTAALYRYYRRRETRSLTCEDKRRLRGCSHDTGMTFILELVHSISFFSLYLFTKYRNDSSFPYKSFWNEFIPVFIPNDTLDLVRNFILVSCKLKITKSCSLRRVAHEYLMWRENHASDNALAEPFGFIMWRQCEFYSGTKLNPEWKSFRYHINSSPFNYRATKHCNGQQAGTAKSHFKKNKYINKIQCSFMMHVTSAQLFVKLHYSFSNSRYRDTVIIVCKCN